MKQQENKRRIPAVCIIAAIVLLIVIATVIISAKYSITWEKGFGIKITPKNQEFILVDGGTVNSTVNPETKHIIFGDSETYEGTVSALPSEGVGIDEGNKIYLYYDSATYTTYILASRVISFNPDSSGMFKDLTDLETVTFSNFSTEKVTNMSSMFEGCPLITELDLTEFNTPKLMDTSSMFASCQGLATVYATNKLDTDKVTSSEGMFTGCYNLVGGEGTRVYPSGSTETAQPLDKTYARIDVLGGDAGYFTGISPQTYPFYSNILKESGALASYSVSGSSTFFTVANGIDSESYAGEDIKYKVELYIDTDADGVFETLHTTKNYTLTGGQYSVQRTDITPLTGGGGVTYHVIKAVATRLTGDLVTLEAVFTLSSVSHSVSYVYDSGILYLTVNTNDEDGEYEFNWVSGIGPDNSDPNLIFTEAAAGPSSLNAYLNKNTEYDFIFFVNTPELRSQLSGDIENAKAIVSVTKN